MGYTQLGPSLLQHITNYIGFDTYMIYIYIYIMFE